MAEARRDAGGLEDFLTYRLTILNKLQGRRLTRFLYTQFNLSAAEWWLLSHLAHGEETTVRALAAATCMDKGQVSRCIERLCQAGYVERRADPEDRRSALFVITDAGRELHGRILPHRRRVQEELTAQLTEQEQSVLYSAIDKLIDHLERQAREACVRRERV